MQKRIPITNSKNSSPKLSRRKHKFMSQPVRVEDPDITFLITSRCIRSELWFVNNVKLEERILALLAKYQEKHGVILYSFQIVGNHYHMVAKFPNMNCAAFLRDFNSKVANSVKLLVSNFPGGSLFGSRPKMQSLPADKDIEKQFLYCALQPVSANLTQRISDYPGYNFSHDAIRDTSRSYKYFRYGDYQDAKRREPFVSRKKFWFSHKLVFSRLPEYEHLGTKEYRKLMQKKLEERRLETLEKQEKSGVLTKKELRKVVPGSTPYSTKRGGRIPLVLSCCMKAARDYLKWYFGKVEELRETSKRYRRGDFTVEFPIGTYRPPGNTIVMATAPP